MLTSRKYLFLDRDGVINVRLPGAYVRTPEEFRWAEGSREALAILRRHFQRIFVVTNQQGIGKGLMSEADLAKVHTHLQNDPSLPSDLFDGIYYCPKLASEDPICRKPRPGMALQAQRDFPEVDFKQSIIVGDSISDLLFGKRLGMTSVLVTSDPKETAKSTLLNTDYRFASLLGFAEAVEWSRRE